MSDDLYVQQFRRIWEDCVLLGFAFDDWPPREVEEKIEDVFRVALGQRIFLSRDSDSALPGYYGFRLWTYGTEIHVSFPHTIWEWKLEDVLLGLRAKTAEYRHVLLQRVVPELQSLADAISAQLPECGLLVEWAEATRYDLQQRSSGLYAPAPRNIDVCVFDPKTYRIHSFVFKQSMDDERAWAREVAFYVCDYIRKQNAIEGRV